MKRTLSLISCAHYNVIYIKRDRLCMDAPVFLILFNGGMNMFGKHFELMNAHISKPVEPDKLYTTLSQLIGVQA